MTFTVEELETYLENSPEAEGYPWGYLGYEGDIETPWGIAERVAFKGGDGDGAWQAVIFKVGDRYFQKDGTHSSWESDYWSGDLYEVEPYEKTITAYRRVK